jgi:hypothetical protein
MVMCQTVSARPAPHSLVFRFVSFKIMIRVFGRPDGNTGWPTVVTVEWLGRPTDHRLDKSRPGADRWNLTLTT